MGKGDEIGSIEVGKQADLAIIDLDAPNLIPAMKENLISHMAYSCQAGNVRDVLIGGDLILRNRELQTMDERAVKDAAIDASEKLING